MSAYVAVPVQFADLPEGDKLRDWMSETLDQLGEFAARNMTITGGRPTIWVAEDGRCWFHISIEEPADLDAPAIFSVSAEGILGDAQIQGPHGSVTIPISVGPSLAPGSHRLIAVSTGRFGPTVVSVAGPVEMTVI